MDETTKAKLATKRWRASPLNMAKDMGITFWPKQAEILTTFTKHTETAVASCHSMGKSFLASFAVLWFLTMHRNSVVVTTGPSLRQVKGIMWGEIRTLAAQLGLAKHTSTSKIELAPKWYAWGFTAPEWDPDRFQGFHAPHVLTVVDEAAGVSDPIFKAVKTTLTGENTYLLMIGNPTDDTGTFGHSFDRHSVNRHTVSAFDTPNFTHFGITLDDIRENTWEQKIAGRPLPFPTLTTPRWARDRWEEWGEGSPDWDARVMARFPQSLEGGLWPRWWSKKSTDLWAELQGLGGPKWTGAPILAVDVAGMGRDSTVFSLARDQGVQWMKDQTKLRTPEIVRQAKHHAAQRHATQIRVDATGMGQGVYDQLAEDLADHQNIKVIEMKGGRRPADPQRYKNQRTEWHMVVRDKGDPDGDGPLALPPIDQLHKDLKSIRWFIDDRSVRYLEPKKARLRRGLKSPDFSDAAVMSVCDVHLTEDMWGDGDWEFEAEGHRSDPFDFHG